MIKSQHTRLQKLYKKRQECLAKMLIKDLNSVFSNLTWGPSETGWLNSIVQTAHDMTNQESVYAGKASSEQKWVAVVYEPLGRTDPYCAMYVQPNSTFKKATYKTLDCFSTKEKFTKSVEMLLRDLEQIEGVDSALWVKKGILKENKSMLFKSKFSLILPADVTEAFSRKATNNSEEEEEELPYKCEQFVHHILKTVMVDITALAK